MPWVDLMASDDVEPGAIAEAEIDGLELVIWRALTGEVSVMAARCPHQWSHLGSEGVVDGCELVCTTHFWRFDRSGNGTKQAMSGRRDEKAPLRTFAVREVDHRICAELPALDDVSSASPSSWSIRAGAPRLPGGACDGPVAGVGTDVAVHVSSRADRP